MHTAVDIISLILVWNLFWHFAVIITVEAKVWRQHLIIAIIDIISRCVQTRKQITPWFLDACISNTLHFSYIKNEKLQLQSIF